MAGTGVGSQAEGGASSEEAVSSGWAVRGMQGGAPVGLPQTLQKAAPFARGWPQAEQYMSGSSEGTRRETRES
jgi:hypothetical protein